jgi:hypothetical protein
MGWIGTEAAENQCEQSCEEAWKIRENPNTKRKERIRRRSENSKKFELRSKWKGWPKEKGLLEKGDGLATAAGARRNEEVTSQYIYKLTRAA